MIEAENVDREGNPKPFNEKEFTEFLVSGLKEAIVDRREFNKLVDLWYNDWRDIKDKKIWPWRGCSNWSVPVTSSAADSIIPRIIEGIFDLLPPIDIQALNVTATKFRDTIKAFLNWDLATHPELFEEIWFFVQNTVWGGTSYIKNFFVKEKTKIQKRVFDAYIVNGKPAEDPRTGSLLEVNEHNTALFDAQEELQYEIKEVTEKKKHWKKYNPEHTCLDIKDVIFPSYCENVKDAWENSFIAVRLWRTKDFLRRQLQQDEKELYRKLDKIKIKGLEAKQNAESDPRKREALATFASKTNKLEIFEIYVNYDVDNDGLDEKVVALLHLDSELLCGWEEFDYEHGECPIVAGHIKPIHKQAFGVGIPEMLFDSKGEIDATHNQRTDRGSLHNNPILTHTEKSGFNKKIHKVGPGRQWRLSDRTETAIGYMRPPQRDEGRSFEEEKLTLSYIQKRSNVSDFNLGGESQAVGEGAGTARGLQALIAEGNVGFRHFIRWMSLSIGQVFRQRFALYQQYWGKATDEEITGWIKEILDVPGNPLGEQGIEAIRQQFNIVMTATKDDKNLELKKAQVAHEILKENPLMEKFPMKLRDVTVDLLRATGIREAETKLPTDDEIKQLMAEIQMMALRQLEQEKAQANIQEAGRTGYEQEKLRLGAFSGGQ